MTNDTFTNDTITRGVIAGAAAGVMQNIYSFIAIAAGFQTMTYADYARATLFDTQYNDTFAQFLGYIGHFTWDTLLGIIFVYFVNKTSKRFLLLKSITYGIVIWYLVKGAPTFFRLPAFLSITPQSMFFFFIGSVLFGITIALTLKFLDNYRIET